MDGRETLVAGNLAALTITLQVIQEVADECLLANGSNKVSVSR